MRTLKPTPKAGFRVADRTEDEDWATLRALAALRDAVRELPDPEGDTVPFRVAPWHEKGARS